MAAVMASGQYSAAWLQRVALGGRSRGSDGGPEGSGGRRREGEEGRDAAAAATAAEEEGEAAGSEGGGGAGAAGGEGGGCEWEAARGGEFLENWVRSCEVGREPFSSLG